MIHILVVQNLKCKATWWKCMVEYSTMPGYTVHIIQEGYCNERPDGKFHADCSITILKGRYNILIDTGGPKDKDLLINGLGKHGVTADQVTHVIGTHGHLDHIGNLNLFPTATFIVSHDIFKDDLFITHDFKKEPYKLDEAVEIITTPGHTGSDISVIVHGTVHGTTAIVGDLFECEADLTNERLWRDVSENPEVQEIHRRAVLDLADFIIPGHGAGFKVPDKNTRQRFQDR